METKARYVVVGLFTILVVVAGFLFVYWLHGEASGPAQASYRVRFDGPVIGLRPGVAVLFNGLRVGEVTSVRFDAEDPRVLMAQISVDPRTPVRRDTQVGIDAQGLMGSATVSLRGGVSTEVLQPAPDGGPPLLVADPTDSQSLMQAAKKALAGIEGIVDDNAKPLHGVITNIGDFAAVLSKNSGRVDNILAGLEKMTGNAGPKAPPLSYDLEAPAFPPPQDPPAKSLDMQIAAAEPTAVVAFETQKVLVEPKVGVLQPLEDGQWADSLPKLVQAKIVQSFENAGFSRIAKTTDGFTPDLQVLLDIRSFQVSLTPPLEARIEIAAKILGTDGKIAGERVFRARAPATGGDTPAAAAALNAAFQTIARDIVDWARDTI